ncbi:hypothetical protein OIV83_004055 [Microbotryomycetes sp. JL201]|nr:hypothetical protein OIV83_004055 [Microbotryomycetes sp. JL201]
MKTIAILAPGQMGASIGAHILRASRGRVQVVTTLHDRSQRTRQLAANAGITDLKSYEAVVAQADMVMSILPPSHAESLAQATAEAIHQARHNSRARTFIDLNAISPETSIRISRLFDKVSGVTYVDGGIIGGPATNDYSPKIVLSGPDAAQVAKELCPSMLANVQAVGTDIGQASALKLSYATLAKGLIALAINAGLLAEQHGVLGELQKELQDSYPAGAQALVNKVPRNVAKMDWYAPSQMDLDVRSQFSRILGEMDEISSAFANVGLDGGSKALKGISETYSMVADSQVGSESIEDALARGRTFEEVLKALSTGLRRS